MTSRLCDGQQNSVQERGDADGHECQLDSVIGEQVGLNREAKVYVVKGRHDVLGLLLSQGISEPKGRGSKLSVKEEVGARGNILPREGKTEQAMC